MALRTFKTITAISIVTALCFFSLLSCQTGSDRADQSELAAVGDRVLELEEAVDQIPGFMLAEDSIAALRQYREDWVRRQLILQEAERLQLSQNSDVRKRLQRLRDEILIQALKDYVITKFSENLEITDEEARNYYQANKDRLVLDEKYVRFRHVVTPDLEAARAAKRDLMRGIEWPEVARSYSKDPEARIQESEKFWPISMAVKDIKIMQNMLRRIGITEISPIHRINGDYHFVQLLETRAAGDHPDLDWLISQIKEWLLLEKKRRHFNSYVKNLYLNAQSNNEIKMYNVLNPTSAQESESKDTLLLQENNE